jgi:hypothetical protein
VEELMDVFTETRLTPHAGVAADESVGEFDDSLLSDSDIVPDDVQVELINWRDIFRGGAFRIGDIANELIIRQKGERPDGSLARVTSARVYRAVGRFCGKSGRTVRYYAEVSAFYPENIRTEFEVVPFSHFVLARQMDDWREVLDFSARNPDYSAERVRAEFDRGIEGGGNDTVLMTTGSPRTWEVAPEEMEGSDPDEDPEAKEMRETSQVYGRRATCLTAVGDLITALDRFERYLVESIPDDDTRKEIVESARALRARVSRLTSGM